MRPAFASLLILVALAFAVPASAQIVNGSFEPAVNNFSYAELGGGSTAIPGWVTTDTGVEWFGGAGYPGYAHDGLFVVDLANYVYSAGGIQQAVPTTPGETYTVTFWLGTQASNGRDGTAAITVSVEGTSQNFTITSPTGALLWQSHDFTFTATGTTSHLAFRCLQNANLHFAYLDGVGFGTLATPVHAGTWGAIKALYR